MTEMTSLAKQAAPKPKLKRMKQRAIRAADLMQKYLAEGSEDHPDMVTYLADKFYDDSEIVTGVEKNNAGDIVGEYRKPRVSVKEKTNIASFFAREANSRAQVAKAAGLSKFSDGAQAPQTVLNINIRADLPLEERIKLIQAEVSGVPLVLPQARTPEIVVKCAETGVASSPPPEVAPPPEIPSQPLQERLDDL